MSKPQAKFGYATDEDAEGWDSAEGCETREAAVTFALAEWPEAAVVFVVDCRYGDKGELFDTELDAERLLETADESASESEAFGHYEDSVFDNSKDSLACLEGLLQSAVDEWLKQYPGPDIWTTVGGTITKHRRAVSR